MPSPRNFPGLPLSLRLLRRPTGGKGGFGGNVVPGNRTSQEVTEVLYVKGGALNRVSQEVVEVLTNVHVVDNRVSQMVVEVLTTIPHGLTGALTAGLAKHLDLPSGYSVRWRAIDANGNDVAGVKISQASVYGLDLGAG